MKTTYRKWIAGKLQLLRANNTRFQIALQLQINESTYRAYEDGRSEPSIMVIQKICGIYNLTVDQFLKDSPLSKVQNFC